MTTTSSERLRGYVRLTRNVQHLSNGRSGDLTVALRDLVRLFEKLDVDYALFGAHAVAAYVSEHRSTEDIDVVTSHTNIIDFEAEAKHFGFTSSSVGPDRKIRTYRHENGARIDVIFDAVGFADLRRAERLEISGVGTVSVAAAVDVAYSKLRTQRSDWGRRSDKRMRDMADVIAMLRENPFLAEELQHMIHASHTSISVESKQNEVLKALLYACQEAQVQLAENGPVSEPLRWVLLLVTILLALTGVALLMWYLS